jgi:hypothetical protein
MTAWFDRGSRDGSVIIERGCGVLTGGSLPLRRSSLIVWLYYRFPASFGEVKAMMLSRGVVVFHEAIR